MQKFSVVSLAIATIAILTSPTFADPMPNLVRLPGHIPASVAEGAQPVERVQSSLPIRLAITLPLRNEPQLDSLLTQLYDRDSPLYGQYLSSEEFTQKFGPTQKDYDAVRTFAVAHGLTVTATHSNRAVLDVSGPASTVENTFGLHLLNYQDATGRAFYAPDSEPAVPASLANVVSGVVGLDNAETWKPNAHFRPLTGPGIVSPNNVGTGPGAGLDPQDLRYELIYGLQGGINETMGLFELDGYNASDINAYENYYSSTIGRAQLIGNNYVPLQNVLIDGFSGKPSNTNGSVEVTLDIELMIAVAGDSLKLMVYEAPNSTSGVVDTYNRIASDNAAKEISSSWGLAEQYASASTRNSENNAFKQMAAQGQSMFVASGDDGAYANGSSLSVQDPASQPYVTSVGGTELQFVSGQGYKQTTWTGSMSGITSNNGGSGGGISTIWPLPSYQQGIANSANHASTTMRNVPDVSFVASPNSEYSIYYNGGFGLAYGTSCASPVWAAYTTNVNFDRLNLFPASPSKARLGLMNPALYKIGKNPQNAPTPGDPYYYDVADGSNNLYYPAVPGYDLATGWGAIGFDGTQLSNALVAY